MEPAWTRKISNPMICNFFFGFYVFYAIIFVIFLMFTLGLFRYSKSMGKMGPLVAFNALISTFLAGTMMMFFYLICDRALIQKAVVDVKENFAPTAQKPNTTAAAKTAQTTAAAKVAVSASKAPPPKKK